jgi:hypothetical protein
VQAQFVADGPEFRDLTAGYAVNGDAVHEHRLAGRSVDRGPAVADSDAVAFGDNVFCGDMEVAELGGVGGPVALLPLGAARMVHRPAVAHEAGIEQAVGRVEVSAVPDLVEYALDDAAWVVS